MPQESTNPTMRPPVLRYHEFGAPGSGDGGVVWAVFPASLTDKEIQTLWANHGDTPPWDGCYRGVGRSFANRARVRRTRTRALVTQSAGLDI